MWRYCSGWGPTDTSSTCHLLLCKWASKPCRQHAYSDQCYCIGCQHSSESHMWRYCSGWGPTDTSSTSHLLLCGSVVEHHTISLYTCVAASAKPSGCAAGPAADWAGTGTHHRIYPASCHAPSLVCYCYAAHQCCEGEVTVQACMPMDSCHFP